VRTHPPGAATVTCTFSCPSRHGARDPAADPQQWLRRIQGTHRAGLERLSPRQAVSIGRVSVRPSHAPMPLAMPDSSSRTRSQGATSRSALAPRRMRVGPRSVRRDVRPSRRNGSSTAMGRSSACSQDSASMWQAPAPPTAHWSNCGPATANPTSSGPSDSHTPTVGCVAQPPIGPCSRRICVAPSPSRQDGTRQALRDGSGLGRVNPPEATGVVILCLRRVRRTGYFTSNRSMTR
jgi:hypothetical protein